MSKGSIQEEDIIIVNVYALNIGSSQYIRQLLTTLKCETDNNTIIARDFNTPLTAMDRTSRQKFNKETQALIFFFFFVLLPFSWAAPVAYGVSQARGRIGAVAAGLRQSHSNVGSERHLQPTPQLAATPDP